MSHIRLVIWTREKKRESGAAVDVFFCVLVTLLLHQRLREGVLRDLERVERKRENQRALEEQIRLTGELEARRGQQDARG